MMRRFDTRAFGLVIALMLAVFPVLGAMSASAAQSNGLQSDRNYESPQFGYSVSWGDDWSVRGRDVISNPGGFDTLLLRGSLGTLMIQGQGDRTTAADAVEKRIQIEGRDDQVTGRDLDGEVPWAEMRVTRNKVRIEGYTLETNGAVVVIVLSAREQDFDNALAAVHEEIEFNGGQILTGDDVVEGTGDEEAEDLSGDVPAEEESPEPDDPSGDVSPDATEEEARGSAAPDREPGDGDDGSATGDGVFTGPLYGYSFTFDTSLWDVSDEFSSRDTDGVQMVTDTGTLMVWGWNAYGADPVGCLEGESDHYEFDDPTVEDWTVADDANGDPIWYETEDYAYAVFTLTYTSEDETSELVDYIECRTLPEQDAVVIIMGSSTPEMYNDHLDVVLDVAETIEFAGQDGPETSEGDTTTTTQQVPDTALSGSLYTSPSFGFTVEIPAQWQVVDEVLTVNDEQLLLSNGTSDVTIWATDAYAGDLAGCVDFVAEQSPNALELAETADGRPFRGDDRNGAYGNFLYEDGSQAFFISCRYIVENESVLILTQDVPADELASQRKFRIDLQQSIEFP